MQAKNLAKLAVAGIMTGGMIFTSNAMGNKDKAPAEVPDSKYKGVHDCAGLNICKGLGGCKVSEAKLEKLAKEAGIPQDKAGKAHECAGHNECKGLGGCKVSAEKLAKLKAKKADKASCKGANECKGTNECKGANSCK